MLARSVYRYWWCLPYAIRSGRWPAIMPGVMRCTWSDIADATSEQKGGLFTDTSTADLLSIDDVGSEVDQFRSGRPTENLREMLEVRHHRRGFTIITTNIPPGEWATRWDSRVADRLIRKSYVCECNPALSFNQMKRGK